MRIAGFRSGGTRLDAERTRNRPRRAGLLQRLHGRARSVPGKGDEQRAAAALASALCVQLGPGIESEEVLKTLGPILKKIICDGAASAQARRTVRPRFRFLSSGAAWGGGRQAGVSGCWGHLRGEDGRGGAGQDGTWGTMRARHPASCVPGPPGWSGVKSG